MASARDSIIEGKKIPLHPERGEEKIAGRTRETGNATEPLIEGSRGTTDVAANASKPAIVRMKFVSLNISQSTYVASVGSGDAFIHRRMGRCAPRQFPLSPSYGRVLRRDNTHTHTVNACGHVHARPSVSIQLGTRESSKR